MKKCSYDKCDNKHYGLGFCQKHYSRYRRYGDPSVTAYNRIDGDSKICRCCNIEKLLSHFRKRGDGVTSYCKDCLKNNTKFLRENDKEWRDRQNLSKRKYILRKEFNLSTSDYDLLLNKQNNVCRICEKEDTKKLAVDHCHKTGVVRGLLCTKCNTALGLFCDNPEILIQAYKYLVGELQ